MNTTKDYLEAVKAKTGAASDYALAPILGLTKQQISVYRNNKGFLGDETAIKVAEILEIDAAIVAAAVHAERAKSDQEKAMWTSMWEKLGGVAASLVVALALGSSPSPAQAAPGGVANSVYYVKSRRRLNPNPFLAILQPFTPAF